MILSIDIFVKIKLTNLQHFLISNSQYFFDECKKIRLERDASC